MKKYFKVQLLIQELVEDDFITTHRSDEVSTTKLDIQNLLTEFYNRANKFVDKKILIDD